MNHAPTCLSDLPAWAADRHPDEIAFRCGDRQWTAAEFHLRTGRLAGFLQKLGVKAGDRVGVFLPRRLESALAVFGILRAGAAYVPIDPRCPVTRAADLLRDCDLRWVISAPEMAGALEAIAAVETPLHTVIGIETLEADGVGVYSWDTVDAAAESAPDYRVAPDDLAYIMYTSGSTGAPKGIMHTHHSGLSYARLVHKTYAIRADDRLVIHAPLHFDMSTLGLFAGPLSGARTLILTDELLLFPAALAELISREAISIWYSVPWTLQQLSRQGDLSAWPVPALRWVLYAGEAYPPTSLRELMLQWPDARFSNVYGPAELNQCTYYHLDRPPTGDAPIPIGRCWDETHALIVNEQDRPVAPGERGELLVHSSTMMQGYWHRPDLDRRAFFSREDGRTYYRTGDLAHKDDQGVLHFHGRHDRQIKTRGFRVELDEVEAALFGLPSVAAAAAFAVAAEDGGREIGGGVVVQEGSPVCAEALLKQLSAILPRYAVPVHLLVAERFPQTSSGKTDRLKLARLYRDQFPG